MPAYDYKCDSCGARFELRHSMHDTTSQHCDDCGSAARKTVGNPTIAFQGGREFWGTTTIKTELARRIDEARSGGIDVEPVGTTRWV